MKGYFAMTWGFFSVTHILSLVAAAGIIVGLYFALKRASVAVQTVVLGVLSFSGIAAVIFNLVMWDSPLEYLPLHLCSVNALLLPIAVFSRNKVLSNLLLLWSLGALAAIVVNSAQADFVLFSDVFCFYFFPHVLEFGIPILLFKLGLVEKHPKYILSTMLITIVIYTGIHFANLAINDYCMANEILNPAGNIVQVNYMYSLVPENPLLALFYSWVPHSYWYMYLIFPIVLVYLAFTYLPQFLKLAKEKKLQKV